MATRQDFVSGGRGGALGKPVEIPADILAQLEKLPVQSKRPWAPWEIEVIKKYYGIKSARDIAKTLGRTIASVQNKANSIR